MIEEHRREALPPVVAEGATRGVVSAAEEAEAAEAVVGAVVGVVDEETTRIEPRKAVALRNSKAIRSPLTKMW
jgi:tRNA-binding EMAP/Myf-like protein